MPIKIRRGAAGDASPLIMFTGFTTSNQSAANISNMISEYNLELTHQIQILLMY